MPGEHTMMMATCGRVGGESGLCRRIVDDQRVSQNTKRSCLLALTLRLAGVSWDTLRKHPATQTCEDGLTRAGYPVAKFIARWSGATAQR